jgi:hypothetical protein
MLAISKKMSKRLRHSSSDFIVHNREFTAFQAEISRHWKTLKSSVKVTGANPLHALCTSTQNLCSVLAELLCEYPDMDEYISVVTDAEEEYSPDGPPMSPITRSMFCYWNLFDAQFGKDNGTMGRLLLDLVEPLKLSSEVVEMITLLQNTKMAVYEYQGRDKECVLLKEMITGETFTCWAASGYKGKANELWFARVLPAPHFYPAESIVLTTPYVLLLPKKSLWIEFVNRALNSTDLPNTPIIYEALMKYGLNPWYWFEYVLLAYSNHSHDMIQITGVPDLPQSLPHSPEYGNWSNNVN